MKTNLTNALRKLITDESGMASAEQTILLSLLALFTLTAITNVTRVIGMATWHAR